MIVVDASVWVSTLVPQNVFHTPSRRWLDEYTDSGGLVLAPVVLLSEIAGAVARRLTSAELGRRALARLQHVNRLRLVPHDLRFAHAAAQLAADLRLRGADSLYVATAYLLSIPLVTWDQELVGRAGTTIAVHRPQ